jgi:translation initiation factor 5B
MLRQPIVAVLGHVDHGKTTLLDKIRGTAVAAREAGAITQHAGASEIPADIIRKIAGPLLAKLNIALKVPGLLLLDTPGHAAFTAMRRRGGSIADLAILVIDINEGIQEQTAESIAILKEFKTPFLVAATKLDRTQGWVAQPGMSFSDSLARQPQHVKDNVDGLVYRIVGQLSERGFESERFDRISDFRKIVAVVPVSGVTGEGIPELLMMLSGLAQAFLSEQLELKSGIGKGSILEVKEWRGLGTTVDIVLYDGEVRTGDWLIVGGREPIVTKIRALLKPRPLGEIRVEKEFESVNAVTAAAGIKIAAPELDKAVAGSPIAAVREQSEIESAKAELQAGISAIEFESADEGVIIRADTLGSLEALISILKSEGIPIKRAHVGPVNRRDIVEAEAIKDRLKRVILAFNLPADPDIVREATDRRVKLISNNIIYRLTEEFEGWLAAERTKMREQKLASVTRPARIKLLPGMVFHVSKPAIVGVEVVAGVLKSGVKLQKDGKEIGEVKALQHEGASMSEATTGQRVAVSIDGPQVGRHIFENDELATIVTPVDVRILEELGLREEAEFGRQLMLK